MTTRLPDIDPRCVLDDGLPWIPLAPYAELVSVKLLSADPLSGEVILVLRAPPGSELPPHRTSSSTTIYTVQGRWKYREHDWVAGPGSLVIEPASACNTPQVLADGTDDAILFMHIRGEVQLLDAEGRAVAAESWRTAIDRYLAYCHENDLEPRDIAPPSLASALTA